MKQLLCSWLLLCGVVSTLTAQKITVEGYVFEVDNRGYLNEVKITFFSDKDVYLGETQSNTEGAFSLELPKHAAYYAVFEKKIFERTTHDFTLEPGKNTVFLKVALKRQPGYLLEITLAEKKNGADVAVDAVHGARAEIYNDTKGEVVYQNDSITSPVFSATLQQGNHYVVMVRKPGYFTKRMEAFVNIDSCYLCMEGFGNVTPGVVSNLMASESNKMGSLLSNIELEQIDTNRALTIQNLYYQEGSSELTLPSRKELDKIVALLRNNPSLIVEIAAHTDAKGSAESNLKLSQQRAQKCVDYILSTGWVDHKHVIAKGYGETRLVNKCADGVTCTEAEHQKNRRTELRIVGIGTDPYTDKSLAEILRAEALVRFALDGNSAQVVAPSASTAAAPSAANKPNFNLDKPLAPVNMAGKAKATLADIEKEYTGYKVELFASDKDLAADAPEIQKIADNLAVVVYKMPLENKQFSYLAGVFLGWAETEAFLEKAQQFFPNAKIVDFYNGKRLD